MNDSLDINALSQETGNSVRTIRYYLAQNLLPPPYGRGPAATYGAGHRDRLRLIRRLQDAHLPLAEIRKQLQAMDDAGVAQALAAHAAVAEPPAGSAYDYVRQVLAKTKSPQSDLNLNQPPPGVALSANQVPAICQAQDEASSPSLAATPAGVNAAPGPRKPQRSNWERITLHPDIELHVRRPLARADQRRLDELLDQAQRIFGGDSG